MRPHYSFILCLRLDHRVHLFFIPTLQTGHGAAISISLSYSVALYFLKRCPDLLFSLCHKPTALHFFFSSGKVPFPPAQPSVFHASTLSRFSVSGFRQKAAQPMDHLRTQLTVVLPCSLNHCCIQDIFTTAVKKKYMINVVHSGRLSGSAPSSRFFVLFFLRLTTSFPSLYKLKSFLLVGRLVVWLVDYCLNGWIVNRMVGWSV